MTFHEKLQSFRRERHLSQEELADRLEVSRQAISKWEVGEIPNLENLVKLSRFFGCSLDYLVNDEVEEPAVPTGETAPAEKRKGIHLPSLLLGAGLVLALLAGAALVRHFTASKMDSQADWNGQWLLFMDWGDQYQAGYMRVDNGTMHAYLNGDRTRGNINTDYTYENGLFDSDVTGEPFAPTLVSPERIILDVPDSWRWKLVRPDFENCDFFEASSQWELREVAIPPEQREFDLAVCCELGTIDVRVLDENGEILRKDQTLIADSEDPSFTMHFCRDEGYTGTYLIKMRGQNGFPAAGWYGWE